MGHLEGFDPWSLGLGSEQPDLRIRSALAELGLPHDVDDDHDFRIVMKVPGKRRQECVLESRTWDEDGLELREVYSVALRSEGPFDTRTATHLLLENRTLSAGCWTVARDPRTDIHLAILRARIPALWRGEELLFTLTTISRAADAVEKRFSGKDLY